MKLGLLTSLLALAAAGCADAADGTTIPDESVGTTSAAVSALEQVASFGTNPGKLNMYRYVPPSIGPNAPLVLALHGCTQGAADMVNAGWNALADKYKFFVVYPETTATNNPYKCFNWAGIYGDPTIMHRNQGENASIKQMVDKMAADFQIDTKRVYAMGFSAGAAEIPLLLSTWPDVFAAGVTFAGIPYDCAESVAGAYTCQKPGVDKAAADWGKLALAGDTGYAGPWPRVSIWQGTSDGTVDPSNTTQMMRQWTAVHGLPQTPSETDTVQGYPHAVYKDASGVVQVETYAITGKDHGTFIDPTNGCGTAASTYFIDAKICGVEYAAKFFGLEGPAATGDGGASSSGGSSGAPADGGKPGAGGYGGSSGTSGASGSSSGSSAATPDAGTFGGTPQGGCGLAGCTVASSTTTNLGGVAFGALFALAGLRRRARKTET